MRSVEDIYEQKLQEVRMLIRGQGGDYDMELPQAVTDSLRAEAERLYAMNVKARDLLLAETRTER